MSYSYKIGDKTFELSETFSTSDHKMSMKLHNLITVGIALSYNSPEAPVSVYTKKPRSIFYTKLSIKGNLPTPSYQGNKFKVNFRNVNNYPRDPDEAIYYGLYVKQQSAGVVINYNEVYDKAPVFFKRKK